MLPIRFRILGPYLASFFHARHPRPPFPEVFRYLTQPSKDRRAARFIAGTREDGEYLAVRFSACPDREFYYPKSLSWLSLCQTVDEIFDFTHWHQFLTGEITLSPEDVVVDCGAAEGLFTFVAAQKVRRVYAVEPIPTYIKALNKNFADDANVTILPYAVGHKHYSVRMSQNELASRISSEGELAVEVRTLDELLLNEQLPVTLIKGDVEGYEFPMLLGAQTLIERYRPRIVLAVYHQQNCIPEICEFLSTLHSDYRFQTRGLGETGNPVTLQAW